MSRRDFRPATVYRPCDPRENEYGEKITELKPDAQTIDIAISRMTGVYGVTNDIRAVNATHAAYTPCRMLDEHCQIERNGHWYTIEFADNDTPVWATLYLKEVRGVGHPS